MYYCRPFLKISIHSPIAEADGMEQEIAMLEEISIHSPIAEADKKM